MIVAGMAKTGKIALLHHPFGVHHPTHDFVALACAHLRECEDLCRHARSGHRLRATHQATEDLNMMRGIADLTIIDPCDDRTEAGGKWRLRRHSGNGSMYRNRVGCRSNSANDYVFEVGRASNCVPAGSSASSPPATCRHRALDAAKAASEKGVDAGVLHVPTHQAVRHGWVLEFASRFDRLIVAENHKKSGGLLESRVVFTMPAS